MGAGGGYASNLHSVGFRHSEFSISSRFRLRDRLGDFFWREGEGLEYSRTLKGAELV